MGYLGKLIICMLFFFMCFGVGEFFACNDELMYYAHRIHLKIKARKAKKNIQQNDYEFSSYERPDRIRFLGKTICCLPILFLGFMLSMIVIYCPENGYSDAEELFLFFMSTVIISLLMVVIGLLLCCYSKLRNEERMFEAKHTEAEILKIIDEVKETQDYEFLVKYLKMIIRTEGGNHDV